MLEGFVLLVTLYSGNTPEVKKPIFFATEEACERAFAQVQFAYTTKRNRVTGGCFDVSDPLVRSYLQEELNIRGRTRR